MFVYVLKSSKDGNHYVGMIEALARRIREHNSGSVTSTRPRGPFQLVYVEEHPDRASARKREKYLKSAAGRRFLDRATRPTER